MELKDITPLLQVIILVIVAPLMPVIVVKLRQWVNANVSQVQQQQIEAAVRVGVLAAEQMGLSGQEAKERAVFMAEGLLEQYGLTVDFEVLADLIEAEVMSQFNHPLNHVGVMQ